LLVTTGSPADVVFESRRRQLAPPHVSTRTQADRRRRRRRAAQEMGRDARLTRCRCWRPRARALAGRAACLA